MSFFGCLPVCSCLEAASEAIWGRFWVHFWVQNRFQRALHIDMPTRYETLPLTSPISMPFERVSVIRDTQFLLKNTWFYTFLKNSLMSNVMLTLNAKALNFNQKFASTSFKINQKSVSKASSFRSRFSIRFEIDFGPVPG